MQSVHADCRLQAVFRHDTRGSPIYGRGFSRWWVRERPLHRHLRSPPCRCRCRTTAWPDARAFRPPGVKSLQSFVFQAALHIGTGCAKDASCNKGQYHLVERRCRRGLAAAGGRRANITRCPCGFIPSACHVSLLQQAIQQGHCAQQELARNWLSLAVVLEKNAAPMTDAQAGWQGPAAAGRSSRKALVTRGRLLGVCVVVLGLAALLTAAPTLSGEFALQCAAGASNNLTRPPPPTAPPPPPPAPTCGSTLRCHALLVQPLRPCNAHPSHCRHSI